MDCSMEELLEVLKSDCAAIECALRQYCRVSADLVFSSFDRCKHVRSQQTRKNFKKSVYKFSK